jgi:HEPN domain-containing protein
MDQANKMTASWLEYARADLDAAMRLLNSPQPNNWTFLLVSWHCHQGIEKMLKRIIVSQEKELIKAHDVVRLYELSGLELKNNKQIDLLKQLNQYYSQTRYPDLIYEPLPKLTEQEIQDLFNQTKELFLWLEKQVQN